MSVSITNKHYLYLTCRKTSIHQKMASIMFATGGGPNLHHVYTIAGTGLEDMTNIKEKDLGVGVKISYASYS